MTRLLRTLRWDILFQWRYGLYLATAVSTVVVLIIVKQLPASVLDLGLPFVMFSDLALVGFYFIAALVLFEKAEGTLLALVVSPLRFGEYLASKLTTLTALAVVISLLVTLICYGPGFNWLLLIAAVALLSCFGLLVGLIAVAPHDTISAFFLPAQVYSLLMAVPLVPFVGFFEHPVFYLWPTLGSLLLLRAAFVPAAVWQIGYGIVYQLVWIVLLAWVARRRFDRYVVGRQGGQ